jgi:tetratricopeptide (TPR) repeat protein
MRLIVFLSISWLIAINLATTSMCAEVNWGDVYYTSGPYIGAQKKIWDKRDEGEKAEYLELHYKAIQYLEGNINRQPQELDLSITGRNVINFSRITLEVIAMYYRMYGDFQKAAELKHKFWSDFRGAPDLGYAEENPLAFVISGYVEAGMYKEALPFYDKRHQEWLETIKVQSDIALFQQDFNEYKVQYPDLADAYLSFIKAWNNARKLAKTTKPKHLAPAVQNHEWFYSDKTGEVLKALEYYSKHKVKFMLEKAAKDKRLVIAKKAKEYLDNWDKQMADDKTDVAPAEEKK